MPTINHDFLKILLFLIQTVIAKVKKTSLRYQLHPFFAFLQFESIDILVSSIAMLVDEGLFS